MRLLTPPPVSSDNPVTSVSLAVSGDPVAQCMLNTSEVTITCNTNGFPRPTVLFRRGVSEITPGVGPFSDYEPLFTDQVRCKCISLGFDAKIQKTRMQ